jgi:hypothetical protein
LLNASLPTPLSPVIKTDNLVGATRIAVSKAASSNGELPMIPNRCLIVCKPGKGGMFAEFGTNL